MRKNLSIYITAVLLFGGLPAEADTIGPLMEGYVWTQLSPYNAECPVVGEGRSSVGCVATAMAQIMHYHRSARGSGETSYALDADGQDVAVNFAAQAYNLDAMSPDGAKSADLGELARFNYHVGASVRMQYSAAESSSYGYAVPAGLIKYFGYAPEAIYQNRVWFTDEEWNAILRNELEHGRPVLYTAHNGKAAHAFILDGVNDDGKYHVIWGWGGASDGWYSLDNLKPTADPAYAADQGAVINIAPELDRERDGVTCYNALRATNTGLPSGRNDTIMTTGDKLTFVVRYLYNFNYLLEPRGEYGLILEDGEGCVIRYERAGVFRFYSHLSHSEYYGLYAANAYSQHPDYTLRISFTVAPDMPDGKYRISLYYRPDYDPTQRAPVRCPSSRPYWVEVTVVDAKVGISSVGTDEPAGEASLYDLTGRPVPPGRPKPGIYIRGGKRVFITDN